MKRFFKRIVEREFLQFFSSKTFSRIEFKLGRYRYLAQFKVLGKYLLNTYLSILVSRTLVEFIPKSYLSFWGFWVLLLLAPIRYVHFFKQVSILSPVLLLCFTRGHS